MTKFDLGTVVVIMAILVGTGLQVLLSGCAKFDAADRVLIAAAVGGQVLDGHSTIQGLNAGCVEANPVFGENPSNEAIIAAKVGVSGVIIGAAYLVENPKWRKWMLGALSVIGIGAAAHNYGVDCQ